MSPWPNRADRPRRAIWALIAVAGVEVTYERCRSSASATIVLGEAP